jgi:hypothetical protein
MLEGRIIKLGVPKFDTPVPVRVTIEGEFPALLVIVRLPVVDPGAVGAKLTLRVMLSPTFNVFGRLLPED